MPKRIPMERRPDITSFPRATTTNWRGQEEKSRVRATRGLLNLSSIWFCFLLLRDIFLSFLSSIFFFLFFFDYSPLCVCVCSRGFLSCVCVGTVECAHCPPPWLQRERRSSPLICSNLSTSSNSPYSTPSFPEEASFLPLILSLFFSLSLFHSLLLGLLRLPFSICSFRRRRRRPRYTDSISFVCVPKWSEEWG